MPSLFTVAEMQQQRDALAGDWQRPRWHFLPPSCWMNDPNGVIQWGGKFHLFYQNYPFMAVHRDMHWPCGQRGPDSLARLAGGAGADSGQL